MNIVNRLTLRNLRLNRKRTLVTIIGIIISTAMITAVATFAVSFMDLMQRSEIASSGNWHLLFSDISRDQATQIQGQLNKGDQVILSRDAGWSLLEESPSPGQKPYLLVKEYDEQAFENYGVNIVKGRLPENDNEIVITQQMANDSPLFAVGNRISANLCDRIIHLPQGDNDMATEYKASGAEPYYGTVKQEDGVWEELVPKNIQKEYTIVGIMEDPGWIYASSPAYTVLTRLDIDALSSEDILNGAVTFAKVDSSIFEKGESLKELLGVEPSYHSDLLAYYGVFGSNGLQTSLYSLIAIVIVIIIVGSISLIYNAFAISVSERSRQLGMLASVGATKKQKRNSVLFEGAVIGGISIPLGILAGLAGMAVTFWCISPILQNLLNVSESLQVKISWSSILAVCLLSVVTILISCWIPARRASRITPVDAIRQTADIGIRGKDVKTSKLTRKIFGFEAELGLKNLKRNRRRYKATIFSLIISVVLFLSVSTFTAVLQKAFSFSVDGVNYDMSVSCYYEDKNDIAPFFEKLAQLEKMDTYVQSDEEGMLIVYATEEQTPSFISGGQSTDEKGYYPYYLSLRSMDDESLEEYARQVGADLSALKDPQHPAAIVVDTVQYNDPATGKKSEGKSILLREGESLPLYYDAADYNNVEGAEPVMEKLTDLTVAKLTAQLPMGAYNLGNSDSLNIVVSQEVFDSIVGQMKKEAFIRRSTTAYIISSDPMGLQDDIYDLEAEMNAGINVNNLYQTRIQGKQMQMIVSVFTYGFVILIVAICVANIFNTISTSISLRRREFAMLQSVGMTPKGFSKMLRYESIFYGLKALLYGLPISAAIMVLMHISMMEGFQFEMVIPWLSVAIAIVGVFLIVGVTMLYSSHKVKKENIIDALRTENL